MDEQRQTCPRRMSEFGPWERAEGLDQWTTGHGAIGQDRVGPSCSFCGSLHPDRFMELVREGWVVEPTRKSYKANLSEPVTDEQGAARRNRWMEADAIARAIRELGERDGKTPAQIQADLDREWTERQEPLLQGERSAKFYYQHLSDEQQAEFIELVNSDRIAIGYPGYFYRLPYFCRRGGT